MLPGMFPLSCEREMLLQPNSAWELTAKTRSKLEAILAFVPLPCGALRFAPGERRSRASRDAMFESLNGAHNRYVRVRLLYTNGPP